MIDCALAGSGTGLKSYGNTIPMFIMVSTNLAMYKNYPHENKNTAPGSQKIVSEMLQSTFKKGFGH